MAEDVWVVGAGITKFGRYPDKDVFDLGAAAAQRAIADAGVSIRDVDLVVVGTAMEPNMAGHRLLRQIGQTGVPIFNVVNACATGATAVRVADLAIKAGEADLCLVVGMEQMGKMGLITIPEFYDANEFTPTGREGKVMATEGILGTDLLPGWFGFIGTEQAGDDQAGSFKQYARIAEKNHAHSALNPHAQYQRQFTLEEIETAPMVSYPNTLLMCAPASDGAAAVVLASQKKLRTMGGAEQRRAVKIAASVLTSDPFVEGGELQPDIDTVTQLAADQAFEKAGIGPDDLDLVELHDCFATAELRHYENLRLCEPGGGGAFLESGAPWRDGKMPVNVSGGLLSKGHPIGATGIAGIWEVTTQLRGEAGDRQINDARTGLAHVLGGGWAASVHILEK